MNWKRFRFGRRLQVCFVLLGMTVEIWSGFSAKHLGGSEIWRGERVLFHRIIMERLRRRCVLAGGKLEATGAAIHGVGRGD